MRLGPEITEQTLPEHGSESQCKVYEKVVNIMKGHAPIVSDENSPTPNHKAFKALYQIVVFLSHLVFEDFGTVDRIVNKNHEIRESNQTVKYAQHCEKLKKEMEESQRTIKILI